MTIHTGFGFSVELFVLIFSLLCWLITPISNHVMVAQQEVSPDENSDDAYKVPVGKVEESIHQILNSFALHDVRKLALYLREADVLPFTLKLTGKGINRSFLVEKILESLPHGQNAISDYLCTRLGND
ncbi:MAG: hypothetical protein KME30_31355 [Iphinoe sp. HA4291-MV1]|jgi:hypothetical protein|nr:hypothetical protein [Iphinoe sp. HA4291-MV1]